MNELENSEYGDVLSGEKTLNDILGSMMLARLHFPEISDDLARFQQLSDERGELVQEIEDLEQRKETLDEEIKETAERIREHIYNN